MSTLHLKTSVPCRRGVRVYSDRAFKNSRLRLQSLRWPIPQLTGYSFRPKVFPVSLIFLPKV